MNMADIKIDGFAKEHLPQSVELYEHIAKLDLTVGHDFFWFKAGGDGDNGEVLMDYFDDYFKKQQPSWHDASIRPPREGRYIVWGLYTFVPDHNDQPNAYWQTRIANWFDSYGWDTKVKYWMELPNPPTE